MNSSRDEALTAMRPPINAEETTVTPAEQFQNTTLRPVLKLQNELLLAIFHDYLTKRKSTFAQMAPTDQLAYIDHSVRQDQKFRNLLVGVVLGHFTADEWAAFRQDEAELTRRLVTMLIQRLQQQLAVR